MIDSIKRVHENILKKSNERVTKYHIDLKEPAQKLGFKSQLFSEDEFIDFFSLTVDTVALKTYMDYFEKSKSAIYVFNNKCELICYLYGSNTGSDGYDVVLTDMSEQSVGINAVGCAKFEDKACYINGSEHSLDKFYKISGYASPYHDKGKNILGFIYCISENTSMDLKLLEYVIALAEIIENNPMSHQTFLQSQLYINILEKMTEHVNEGVLFIDEFDNVHGYNSKLVNMLQADPNAQNFSEYVKDKLLKMNAYNNSAFNNETVLLKEGNTVKHFIASNQQVYLLDRMIGTIVTLTDLNDVSRLHYQIKGNDASYTFEDIIGMSDNMHALRQLAQRVSKTNAHILINGESGTGKELLGQSIHNNSHRSHKPFIAINCGAMPLELMESELFGYEAGSFTGALKSGKVGKLEYASGGTLFLDEIESMPLTLQIKLLRVLSTKSITRIGGIEEIPVDLRILAATKKDLLQLAKKGHFREDLYYRIQIFELSIPPLRDRKEDIIQIINNMTKTILSDLVQGNIVLTETFINALMAYDWPGNVRELRNVIERALILSQDSVLSLDHLKDEIVTNYLIKSAEENVDDQSTPNEGLYKHFEMLLLQTILNEEDGNMSLASKRLGISRQTLYRKMKWSDQI